MTQEIEQAWDEYAQKFNTLADKMEEVGLPCEWLREVVDAARRVEILGRRLAS